MYERILVALDGSDVAERVLPHVEVLAAKFGSAVTLLRATTSPEMLLASTAERAAPVAGPVVDPTPIVEAERQAASAYLGPLAQRLRDRGLTVDGEQLEGSAAEVIVEHARRTGVDLIAMTTHGRGGLGRLVFGSIADEVLHSAPCPVLLVRVDGGAPRPS